MANAPVITIRSNVSPYSVISSLAYVQSTLGGDTLPVLGDENSRTITFRVYNNFGLLSSIASATNVLIQAFDGVNIHAATQSVVNQSWVRVQEAGYGENSLTPGQLTAYLGADTAIGGKSAGADFYSPEIGSDGAAGNHIRAGTDTNGVGFIEFTTYAELPQQVGMYSYSFALSIHYEWTP